MSQVNVKAPIIYDLSTQEGVQPLIDFVQNLYSAKLADISNAEAERLSPYLKSLSTHLNNLNQKHSNIAGIGDPVKPDDLKELFNNMSDTTGTVVLSDALILPWSKDFGPHHEDWNKAHRFVNWLWHHTKYGTEGYSIPALKNKNLKPKQGYYFDFGFIRFKDEQKGKDSEIAFPYLQLDHRILKLTVRAEAQPLTENIKDALNIANHDPLHHVTSVLLNTDFIDIPKMSELERFETELVSWQMQVIKGQDLDYEDWACRTQQEAVLVMNENSDSLLNRLNEIVNSHVQHLTETLQKCQEISDDEAYNLFNYYALLMGHVLTRALPLNHPIILNYLKTLENIDPAREKISQKQNELMVSGYIFSNESTKISNLIRDYFDIEYCSLTKEFPNHELSYLEARSIQLIFIGYNEIEHHKPIDLDKSSKIEKATINMINASRRTAKPDLEELVG